MLKFNNKNTIITLTSVCENLKLIFESLRAQQTQNGAGILGQHIEPPTPLVPYNFVKSSSTCTLTQNGFKMGF